MRCERASSSLLSSGAALAALAFFTVLFRAYDTLVRPGPDSAELKFRNSSCSDKGLAVYHGRFRARTARGFHTFVEA
jgi:hypothetical protein